MTVGLTVRRTCNDCSRLSRRARCKRLSFVMLPQVPLLTAAVVLLGLAAAGCVLVCGRRHKLCW